MKNRLLVVLAAGLLMFGAAGMAQANLITNGSFENGSYTGDNNFQTLSATSTAITGWTVTNGSVDWIKNYWNASNGNMSLDLAGTSNGTIVGVDFATVVGQSYLVQFDMAGNPDRNYNKALVGAKVGGTPYNFSFTQGLNNRTNMGWETKSFSFVANSTLTELSFGNISNNAGESWGAALDNVRVDAVPEPGTMVLFGAGLLGLAVYGKRRMNKDA